MGVGRQKRGVLDLGSHNRILLTKSMCHTFYEKFFSKNGIYTHIYTGISIHTCMCVLIYTYCFEKGVGLTQYM